MNDTTEYQQVKVDELIGAPLDWAVAYAVKAECIHADMEFWLSPYRYKPSSVWMHGGQLLDKYPSALPYRTPGHLHHLGMFSANTPGGFAHHGPTPLIAAMRAIVAAAFGLTVNIPKELCSHDHD